LDVGFEADLLFGTGTERLGPNDAELCLVLTILKYDQTPNFELAMDRAQPNSISADVERMDKFRIGLARNVVPGNSYGQNRFRPV
jgi:hypothetical protein